MAAPLMPKATAVWLVENTTLTFDQISAFTGLHPLEIQAIADGEVVMQTGWSSSLRTAGIGPMPITRGSTPATALPTNALRQNSRPATLQSWLPRPLPSATPC